MSEEYFIKEKSLIAYFARKVLRAKTVAIVLRKTIYLNGVNKESFLANQKWLKHELCHIKQFQQYGFFRFLLLYITETFRNGYYNNRFEVEAREAEKSTN